MAKCKSITPTKKDLCLGALRYKIKINDRVLNGVPSQTDAAHSETYTLFKIVRASIETKDTGVTQTLDGVVIDPDLVVTHIFLTRFLSTINAEQYIEFQGFNYKILKAENIDQRGEWLRIRANFRGELAKAGAQ